MPKSQRHICASSFRQLCTCECPICEYKIVKRMKYQLAFKLMEFHIKQNHKEHNVMEVMPKIKHSGESYVTGTTIQIPYNLAPYIKNKKELKK